MLKLAKTICLLSLTLPFLAWGIEDCDPPVTPAPQAVTSLASDVAKATNHLYTKLVDLKVRHAGSGDLSILLNPEGEVEAVKFFYKNGNEVKNLVVSTEDLNKGRAIQYPGRSGSVSPLKLDAVRPPGVNPGTGGVFNLQIATKLSPPAFVQYQIHLVREGKNWVVEYNGTRPKSVVLNPGISFLSWDGTFQKVEFQGQ